MQFQERRQHGRKVGDGLIVLINGKTHPIIDISVAGVAFQAQGYRIGDRIRLSLAALRALDDAVEASVTIRAAGNGVVRCEFIPTAKLMRYIITHIGEITGQQPAYFR